MEKNVLQWIIPWGFSRKMMLAMRISIVLLFAVLMQISATSVSQEKVNLEVKEKSMRYVFKELRKQTGLYFVYNEEELDQSVRISAELHNVTLEEALLDILKETKYDFEITDGFVVIKPGKRPPVIAQPQEKIIIRGTVKDENGDPLPFAAVCFKGTTTGCVSAIDGVYELEVPNEADVVLEVSSLGFVTQEIEVQGRTYIDIVLEPDMMGLDEVVVTGYQTLSRERVTGAFGNVRKEQINRPTSNISERIIGAVAGVQATTDADGNISLEVRGQTSLLGDAKPLIIVDGFPIEGGFSTINPNDVESINVLKDAAAASIWGAKSANGVIVITTKNAKSGKVNVEFSSFARVSPKLDLDYVNPRASSQSTIEYERRGFESGFFGLPYYRPTQDLFWTEFYHTPGIIAMNQHMNGNISEDEMERRLSELAQLSNKGQIRDNLLQNPFTQQYNLSISGGNDHMNNNLSVLFENKQDYFKENHSNNYMINYKNNVKITDWLNFNLGSMLQLKDYDRSGVTLGEIKRLAPYDMLVNTDGSLADLNHLFYYKPVFDEFVPQDAFPYADWSYNPITEIQNREIISKEVNARIQAGLNFRIMDGLSFDSKFFFEMAKIDNSSYYSDKTFAMRRMVNETSTWDKTTNEVTANMPKGGGLTENHSDLRNYNFRNQLSFSRTLNSVHSISFIAGSEVSKRILEYRRDPHVMGYDKERLSVGGLIGDGSMWLGLPLSSAVWNDYPIRLDYVTPFYSESTDKYFSLYTNLAYTYNDKYSISGSVRTDASNLITDDPKYRYEPFWSVGIGWNITNENFMNDIEWLDRLHLRSTYGTNGNVDRSTSFRPLLNIYSYPNQFTNDIAGVVSSHGNPTLRWETTTTFNTGLDFSVARGKLYGSIDWYRKLSSDLIVKQSITSVHGTTSQKINNGEMLNQGIELSLGTSVPIVGNKIRWAGIVNFAYNNNEIRQLFKNTYIYNDLRDGGSAAYVEGYDANTLWALRYGGIKNVGTENDPKYAPVYKGVDDEVKQLSESPPSVDAREYMAAQGTTVAPYNIGFTNNFTIQNFNFSFIITGKFGHVFRTLPFKYDAMLRAPNSGEYTYVNIKYNDVVNGDPNKIVPIPDEEPEYIVWDWMSTIYLDYLTANAGHIRLQEVNLTYDVPAAFVNKLGIGAASVFAQGNNLGSIFFNEYNEDPEFPLGTIRPQAMYTFGIKINL